jgi:hypothetical protein
VPTQSWRAGLFLFFSSFYHSKFRQNFKIVRDARIKADPPTCNMRHTVHTTRALIRRENPTVAKRGKIVQLKRGR